VTQGSGKRGGVDPGDDAPLPGQEAVPVGAIAALRDDDHLTITDRGHGHALARGVSIDALIPSADDIAAAAGSLRT